MSSTFFFTVSGDLDAAYPAVAAREIGFDDVALFCVPEMAITGSLPRCVRVLIHWNTTKTQAELEHAYIGDAARLRPEFAWPRRAGR